MPYSSHGSLCIFTSVVPAESYKIWLFAVVRRRNRTHPIPNLKKGASDAGAGNFHPRSRCARQFRKAPGGVLRDGKKQVELLQPRELRDIFDAFRRARQISRPIERDKVIKNRSADKCGMILEAKTEARIVGHRRPVDEQDRSLIHGWVQGTSHLINERGEFRRELWHPGIEQTNSLPAR